MRCSRVIIRALVGAWAHATAGLDFLRGPEATPDIDGGEKNNCEHDDGLMVHATLLLLIPLSLRSLHAKQSAANLIDEQGTEIRQAGHVDEREGRIAPGAGFTFDRRQRRTTLTA